VADAGDQDLRVSDEQRERAVQDIREHFAAGRLTEDELSDRVEAAYAAQTQRELAWQLADLPRLPATRAQQKAELAARRNSNASSASSSPAGTGTRIAASAAPPDPTGGATAEEP
jgi:hypothetical protein